jgi:predicted GIY-YIG superfamily endonuclease
MNKSKSLKERSVSSDVSALPAGLADKGKWCVYFLTSADPVGTGKGGTYCGKTNDLRRRLRQHNGLIVGGARSTSAEKIRPWRLGAVVCGLASNSAALKFEFWNKVKHTRGTDAVANLQAETAAIRQKTGARHNIAQRIALVQLACDRMNLARSVVRWRDKEFRRCAATPSLFDICSNAAHQKWANLSDLLPLYLAQAVTKKQCTSNWVPPPPVRPARIPNVRAKNTTKTTRTKKQTTQKNGVQ